MADVAITRAFYGLSDRTAVLVLVGPIRYPAARALRAFVDAHLAAADVDAIAVDLRGATFVDSTGLGLVARIGKHSLSRHGRRLILVCPENDVAIALRSATFDVLCAMVEDAPFDAPEELSEVPLHEADPKERGALGRVILDAHRDLAALSPKNHDAYAAVIAALEAELGRGRAP